MATRDVIPRGRVVSVANLAVKSWLPNPVGGTDAADARWAPVVDVLASRLGTVRAAIAAVIVTWGLIWGLIPLAAQVWMLRADPQAQEAVSAANVSNMQISIAAGSGLGGLLVDSAGLAAIYPTAGAIALASAAFALIAGHRFQPPRSPGTAGQSGPTK